MKKIILNFNNNEKKKKKTKKKSSQNLHATNLNLK